MNIFYIFHLEFRFLLHRRFGNKQNPCGTRIGTSIPGLSRTFWDGWQLWVRYHSPCVRDKSVAMPTIVRPPLPLCWWIHHSKGVTRIIRAKGAKLPGSLLPLEIRLEIRHFPVGGGTCLSRSGRGDKASVLKWLYMIDRRHLRDRLLLFIVSLT